MKTLLYLFIVFFSVSNLFAQDFDYYFIGDTNEIAPNTTFGVCLMGGAGEDDNGAEWFLNRANGGNIVVLRASGSDGYHQYFYNDLGINVQSVETIVFNNADASNDPFVQRRLENAEGIWIAGGDQFIYEQYWKNTPIQDIINDHINIKEAPIGGTSAGMAILGEFYYNAENGSVTSNEALENPFDNFIIIENNFISIPYLKNTITDTHYDNPDRKGRHATFVARLTENDNQRFYGIAANEYVAICIDENGQATVFGDYPNFDDKAYFIQNNCRVEPPEIIEPNTPLTWIGEENDALIVYEIEAREDGTGTFSLTNWETGSAGEWKHWTIDGGELIENSSSQPNCVVGLSDENKNSTSKLYPNPSSDMVKVESEYQVEKISVLNALGKEVLKTESKFFSVKGLAKGMYSVRIITENEYVSTTKLLVE